MSASPGTTGAVAVPVAQSSKPQVTRTVISQDVDNREHFLPPSSLRSIQAVQWLPAVSLPLDVIFGWYLGAHELSGTSGLQQRRVRVSPAALDGVGIYCSGKEGI